MILATYDCYCAGLGFERRERGLSHRPKAMRNYVKLELDDGMRRNEIRVDDVTSVSTET